MYFEAQLENENYDKFICLLIQILVLSDSNLINNKIVWMLTSQQCCTVKLKKNKNNDNKRFFFVKFAS